MQLFRIIVRFELIIYPAAAINDSKWITYGKRQAAQGGHRAYFTSDAIEAMYRKPARQRTEGTWTIRVITKYQFLGARDRNCRARASSAAV